MRYFILESFCRPGATFHACDKNGTNKAGHAPMAPGSYSREEEATIIRLAQAAGADTTNLGRLLESLRPLMLHIAGKYLYRRDDAEDAVQEALGRIFGAIGRFNFDYRLSTWMSTVVIRVALNMIK